MRADTEDNMAVELYDEHEQSERVRSWIKEYGISLAMGLALALAGVFGYGQWQQRQAANAQLAAEYYDVIQEELAEDRLDTAEEQFQAMASAVGDSAYYGLASLLMAGAYVEDGRLGPAADLYREILANESLSSIHPMSTTRLARVLHAQGDSSAALSLVRSVAPEGFVGAWAEIRGDILVAQGELEQARAAYQEALDNLVGQGVGRNLLQIKLDATGPGLNEDAS
jgi:predicted negative regulator of RcsB-dependent stress response